MGLVRDIQKAAINSEVGLPQLLRMGKLLASRLGNDEFKRWIDNELNGYGSKEDLPSYRIFASENRGNLVGPAYKADKVPLPTGVLPEWAKEHFSKVYLTSGVVEYEALVERSKAQEAELSVQWPADLVAAYAHDFYRGMALVSAWQVVSAASLTMVLDTVRTRLLEFVLALDEATSDLESIDEGRPTFTESQLRSVFNTTIYGGMNNVSAGGTEFSQVNSNVSIKVGDLGSLREYLKLIGIEAEDVDELVAAIEEDESSRAPGRFGERVAEWIGKMTGKAASGAWSVSVSASGSLLARALESFYGTV